ncbi:amidohydrolase family protein [bacterium]|nr:amidohydrolase family protein [bacterium]
MVLSGAKRVITGAEVLVASGRSRTSVWINNGLIEALGESPLSSTVSDYEVVNASGLTLTAGLVDIQVNGGARCNLWEVTGKAELQGLCRLMAEHGVTTFLPTLITDSVDRLCELKSGLVEAGVASPEQMSPENSEIIARMPGFHLEGPFLSPQRPGVHPVEHIVPPDSEKLSRLVDETVLLVTLAPEEDKDGASIKWLRERGVKVSAGHTNADYEEAKQAFDAGIRLATHLFNAMPGIHHRDPGIITAALLDRRVTCCLIADGLHLAPAMVDLIFRMKAVEKVVLVTDIAYVGTADGGLVGSSITLDEAVRNLVRWGICSFDQAIQMATINPASAVGLGDRLGSLDPGKLADLVLWQEQELKVNSVISGGRSLAPAP